MKLEEEIVSYRKEIDKLDVKISQLLIKRFMLTSQIGRKKKLSGKNIADVAREKQVINNALKDTPFALKKSIKQIFQLIITESKKLQKDENK